jgi:cytosine/uracil/thiamine/allantoin permease
MLADYFVIRKGAFKQKKGINWMAIAIWVLGIGAYQITSRQFPGFSASLVSFIAVFILYVAVMKIFVFRKK